MIRELEVWHVYDSKQEIWCTARAAKAWKYALEVDNGFTETVYAHAVKVHEKAPERDRNGRIVWS